MVESRAHLVRHIEPSLCVDDDLKVLTTIRPFIGILLCLSIKL
jgi:hypothetical protein